MAMLTNWPMKDDNACVVCGSTAWRLRFHKQGFDFVECRDCRLLTLSPIPSPESLAEHYSKRAVSGNYEPQKAAERLPTSVAIFDLIEKHSARPGRIFDIGCFDGQLLDIAKVRGWKTWGLELQGAAAQHAAKSHHVSTATVEDYQVEAPHSFDVVSAIGLIEHVRDPLAFMSLAQRLLVPGGVLVIQTPNWGSVPARLMQRYWMPIAAPEHIYYFSHHNLKRLCARFGFDELAWQPHWKKLRMGYVFDQLSYFGEELSRPIKAIRPIIPNFVEQSWWRVYGGEMLYFARLR
jgi:2-polyprenyl-3-methyl-5-hydroxy-6-metoxy-1,4-benzoquinol methylase